MKISNIVIYYQNKLLVKSCKIASQLAARSPRILPFPTPMLQPTNATESPITRGRYMEDTTLQLVVTPTTRMPGTCTMIVVCRE